jgi:endonuclease/exonuclease/phosphatase (EEP) superfamily protein YafD
MLMLSLVVACSSALGLAMPATAVGSPISVWTFNACGQSCHHGAESPITTGIGLVMTLSRPFAVMIQELCLNQAEALADLTGYHWEFASGINACVVNGVSTPFGNAVFSRNAFTGERYTVALPNPQNTEPRTVVCNSTPGLLSDVVLCSTHLSPGRERRNRTEQAKIIADMTSQPVAFRGTLVIGGDFNANPTASEMTPLYNSYSEADSSPSCVRCGRPTHNSGAKFDYLWEFDARGGGVWQQDQTSAVPGVGGSDHLLYRSVLAP